MYAFKMNKNAFEEGFVSSMYKFEDYLTAILLASNRKIGFIEIEDFKRVLVRIVAKIRTFKDYKSFNPHKGLISILPSFRKEDVCEVIIGICNIQTKEFYVFTSFKNIKSLYPFLEEVKDYSNHSQDDLFLFFSDAYQVVDNFIDSTKKHLSECKDCSKHDHYDEKEELNLNDFEKIG